MCLCEGLCSSAYLKNHINKPKENIAVAICPGPNLAYFNSVYTLDEMVKHIYGKIDLLAKIKRPNLFIKELNLYIDYLQAELHKHAKNMTDASKRLIKFKMQLRDGITYYKRLFTSMPEYATDVLQYTEQDLILAETKLDGINILSRQSA